MTTGASGSPSRGPNAATRPDPEPGERPSPPSERFGTGGLRSLAGRVGWAMTSEVVNLVGTALLFFVLADRLGTVDWGSLQAVVSIALIVGPLVTFGANWQLMRRSVVADRPAEEVGRAVSVATVGTGGAALTMIALAVLVPGILSDISRVTIALVLVARMPAYWLVELGGTAAVARADLRQAAVMRLTAVGIRLGGLGVFLVSGATDVDTWAWYMAGSELVAAATVHGLLARSLGAWSRPGVPPVREFVTGFPYGLGNTTEGMLSASDRPLLKQFGFDEATGLYAAGYRVVSLGFLPMMALLRAQDRRFFRQGAAGSAASHRAGLAMARYGLVVTVPVTVGLLLVAPLFDVVLRADWSETVTVIRVLALLPVIKGLQFSFGNALTAAGNQTTRMTLTGAAAGANLIGNLLLIPRWSWHAAAATTVVAEVGLTIAFFMASSRFARTRPVAAP